MQPPDPPSPAPPLPTLAPVVPGRRDDRGLAGAPRPPGPVPRPIRPIRTWSPSSTVNPSSASGVATTAFPAASASMTLTRMPPPVNSGAMTTAARSRKGPTSATSGLTSSPSPPGLANGWKIRSHDAQHDVGALGSNPAAGCRRSVVPPTRRWAGGMKLPTKSSSPGSPAASSAREGTETPSGMISMGVVPASGLSVAASRSVSATTACTLDMTPRSNRSQARSSSPPKRRASPDRCAVRVPRRRRARLVLSQHPRRRAARERGEIGPHDVILQLHDVGLPRSRDLSDGTRELGTERPGDRSGRPPCQLAGNPEPPSEAAHGAGGRTSGDLPDEVASLQQPGVGASNPGGPGGGRVPPGGAPPAVP